MNKQIKIRKRISLALALCLVMSLAIGSLAYFTDRVEMNAKITAGTVGISENATANWTTQLQNGPQALDNINPGDSRSLAFTVTNTGNKAVDVRHTLKMSVVDAAGNAKEMSMGEDINGEKMLQFDIFKASDVQIMSNNNNNAGYLLFDGAEPIYSSDSVNADTGMGASRVVNALSGTVTYYFADSVLDGVGGNAETGYAIADQNINVNGAIADSDVAALADGNTDAVKYDYVLIFRDTTLNDFQGCTLHLELVIEAKQHLNTKSSWENIETVSYDMVISGVSHQDTNIKTAPNNQTGVLEDVTNVHAGTYNTHTAH